MPELPEVETIRRGLEKYLVGKEFEEIEIRFPKLFQGDPLTILHTPVKEVRRFGKGLVIDFTNGYSLVVHVKMTGQFVYRGEETVANFHPTLDIGNALPNTWTHVIFKLKAPELSETESYLYYNDIRKFGWLKVVKTQEVQELSFFKALGPEPFVSLTPELFDKALQTTAAIKSVLMDQKKIAGIGNIYANEALFVSRIDPRRPAKSLTEKERKELYHAVLGVLQKGIQYGGASDVNYINVEGTKGEYQHHFLVYRKNGQPCPVCSGVIQRIVVGGRGTFFCSYCQK